MATAPGQASRRASFLQFLTGLFQMDPTCRWTAKQAWHHSFVNDDVPFSEDFQPVAPGMGYPSRDTQGARRGFTTTGPSRRLTTKSPFFINLAIITGWFISHL
eukprot:Skav208204  [mRNA]  locus=scaffold2026:192866:197505:+ [translate_table: standard]